MIEVLVVGGARWAKTVYLNYDIIKDMAIDNKTWKDDTYFYMAVIFKNTPNYIVIYRQHYLRAV